MEYLNSVNGLLLTILLGTTICGHLVKVQQSHYRPQQALRVPGGWCSQISRQSAHKGGKVVSPTHWPPLPQEIFLVLIAVMRPSQPQGHSVAGRIMSMKNSNDTIGNWTCDLPVCTTVPQPNVPSHTPLCGHLPAVKLYYISTTEITYFRKGGNSVIIESDTNSHEECTHPLHQLLVVIVFIWASLWNIPQSSATKCA